LRKKEKKREEKDSYREKKVFACLGRLPIPSAVPAYGHGGSPVTTTRRSPEDYLLLWLSRSCWRRLAGRQKALAALLIRLLSPYKTPKEVWALIMDTNINPAVLGEEWEC